ncbi:hypothetical protein R3P38DRAFT_141697 [Favolaschia claudopus]|uniref:CxC2-like cysteine cluster KDZ transposase-associated domain-containing protein n=1 Tax=Favolaschia claudopus TaxID=2862362 RepID=A0AAV9ZWF9_9AGAR
MGKRKKFQAIGSSWGDEEQITGVEERALYNPRTGKSQKVGDLIRQPVDSFPSTKLGTPPVPLPPPPPLSPPPASDEPNEDTPEKEKKCVQGASVFMKQFMAARAQIERAIFSSATHPQLQSKEEVLCGCGEPALFRCLECGVTAMRCATCIVERHSPRVLHHIEKWDGHAFVRDSLCGAGQGIHLLHDGRKCRHAPPASKGREFVLAHTNGIHVSRIFFCRCPDAPEDYIQLLRERLYPATLEIPQTAFTFDVLHHSHVLNLTSKISGQDYYRSLQKLTDGAFPEAVPDRYREFMRVGRLWRNFTARRRSGQAQDIDTVITNRRPDSLAIRCPACPEVGFNVDKSTIDGANENEKHKHTLFLSVDGNFKLQRKRKTAEDPDDVALNEGNAYFPEDTKYRKYVREVRPSDEVCTCSNLKAVRMQNIAKFKNSVISGVIAVQCARHGFYMPGAIVDMPKGEAYSLADYALGQALWDQLEQRWILLSYDVWCQYFKKITERFAEWFPGLRDLIERLTGIVPKMHIRNHIAQCQTQWSSLFIEFIAFLIGELIEGAWGEMNQFAGATKEANHGHRHDMLDDALGQWNWDKVIHMPATLLRLFREACSAIRKRSVPFEEYTEMIGPDLVSKWKTMPKTWNIDKNGKYWTPFEAHLENVKPPPTSRSAYEKLLQQELTQALASGPESGISGETEYIARGVRIEKDQQRIKRLRKTKRTGNKDTETGSDDRARLRKELSVWRSWQFERFPTLHTRIADIDPSSFPENEPLFLPSSLPQHELNVSNMTKLAKMEEELRVGEAHDALASVREAILVFNFNVAFKIAHIQGQSSNTRAQNFLRILANDRIISADEYRRHRMSLIKLGLPEDDKTLQPLDNSELYAKNYRELPKMGDSAKVDPWFWTVGQPSDQTPQQKEQWSIELQRVKWFRDRASYDRALEQKELVEEEFKRTIRSFKSHAAAWKTIRDRSEPRSGEAAYAHLKSRMYTRLAEDCEKLQASAPSLADKDRIQEEKEAADELKKKGLLNKELSVNWEDYLPTV